MFAVAVYLWTTPGRVEFPDDEIVFQTTASLWDDGDLAIAGIPRPTGEPKGRAPGTFGWAEGVDGRRYGFFGHGLSLVALPLYALADATVDAVPIAWPHAVRSDHFVFHRREHRADWTRLVTTLVNCFVTGATAWLLALWVGALGFAGRTALATGAAYAFATSAWAYSRTMLSEPLSGLCLVAAAWCVTRWRAAGGRGWLWAAGAIAGFSLHVHVLNLTFVPCLVGLVWGGRGPVVADGRGPVVADGRAGAAVLLALGAGLLLLGQWLRFGDPLETGRFGHYSWFVWPWEGLAAQVVAPGRSFLLYSPAVALGLCGWAALRRRGAPAVSAMWFALAVIGLRWLTISTRSDWFGGWGVGPRHLVPVIPAAMLGFAAAIEDVLPRWRAWARRAWWAGVAGAVLVSAHLGVHSIFEWMLRLARDPDIPARGLKYMDVSHWEAWASPIVGFWSLPQVDVLAVGAVLLARLGHPSLLVGFMAVALVGGIALVRVVQAARRP